MWLVNIIAFLIVTIYIAYKSKENMAQVFPLTACGWIILLYVLAYFRCLSWIDDIGIGIIAVSILYVIKCESVKRKEFLQKCKKLLMHPTTLMILITCMFISILVRDRIVLWWDDLNFWATDVKSIYYLDGFAGKYGNVAPEFGDYPPGVQLFKWWFLHFSPNEFKEGMMFAGYYTLNILLLAPLFSNLKNWENRIVNTVQYICGGVCLFVLPSVIETFYLEGNCSDLPMGIAYGLFLWSVIDEKNHNLKFSYFRQSFSLALVMLCKNTGFQWAIYGLLFWFVYHWFMWKEERRGLWLRFMGISFLPVLLEGSWLLSCLLKRRVAKLTGAGIKMVMSGVVPAVDYRKELVENFIKGFAIEPIHRMNTAGIDLSVLGFIFLSVIVLLFLRKEQVITKKQSNLLLIFWGISGLVSYGITLTAHLTIFVTELQYLEARVMTASIERYGVPFTMGLLYIIWGLWINREHKWSKKAYVFAMMFVILCGQWPGVYDALVGYRSQLVSKLEERNSMIETEVHLFAEKTKDIWKDKGTRILYMRDGSKNHWVKDTYINFEVSPLGVVYGNIVDNLAQPEVCRQVIEESHANYLYADKTTLENGLFFEEMVENFAYETLYRIETVEGKINLRAVE